MIQAISHVFRFELQRSLTPARVLIWLALCLFPVLLVGTLYYTVGSRTEYRSVTDEFGNEQVTASRDQGIPDEAMTGICFALVPQISCMLGLLIWATPAVGSELEAQTWIHLAMRPRGRSAVALGKYGVAVLWTASYTIISSVLVGVLSGVENQVELILALVSISALSSMSYAALYLLLGAVFFRRASIVAVIYSLILEGAISFVPATINQAAVSFRLRTLIVNWTVLKKEEVAEVVPMGTEAPWVTILLLVAYSVALLAIACFIIRTREYPVQVEA